MGDIDFFTIIACIINIVATIYILSKIFNKNPNLHSYEFYIVTILFMFLVIMNFFLVDSYLRIFISTFLATAYSLFIFDVNFNIAIIGSILGQMIMFISELIVIIIFGAKSNYLAGSTFGILLANMLISIISIVIVNNRLVRKQYTKLFNCMININFKFRYIMMFLLIGTLNILWSIVYLNYNNIKMLYINIIFIIIYSYILYFALSEKNKNINFKAENKVLMDHLNEYEKMLDYQRVSNHEDKNQLLVIKNMVGHKNQKLIDYIDEIIKDKKEDNEILLSQAKKIPSGGLQGIIYQKMLIMEEHNIKFDLGINKNIKDLNLNNINSKLNYDICRIVGIFLDNAIEETIKTNEKIIQMSIYNESGHLVIIIANYFKDQLDMVKLGTKGYTTKGEGHGYGLALAKKIVKANFQIYNETQIIKNIFEQTLKIKM